MAAIGFWAFAQQDPTHLALVDPDGQHWSRGELLAESNRLVHALRDLGLQAGDTVAAMLPNCAQFIALNLAISQAGMFLAPINWHLAAPEVAYIVEDSHAKAFFFHSKTLDASLAAIGSLDFNPDAAFLIDGDGSDPRVRSYRDWLQPYPGHLPEQRSTGMVMFYTSGTTGKPKGVRRAILESNPDKNAIMMGSFLMLFGIEPEADNVHFCGSPMYHTAAMNWAINSLHMGHTVVLHDKWDAERMLEAIDRYKVTTAHVVPTQMVRLLKLPEQIRERYQVRSMRHLLHTAAPCAPEVKRSIIDWFGPCVCEYYASTEGGGAICTSQEWLDNPGTVGKAWYGADIKIFDDEGNELPAGETGTVYMLMSELSRFEYKGDREKTEKDRRGNYFTAGDIGYLNADGFLFLCDRKIDMIISGGANIYPAEIESVLITHPKVFDCCVFGIPHEEWGEEIKAVIQPIEGVAGDESLTQEILTYCSEQLARMKLPRSIDYMEALPRDPNGKLYKRRLRDPYWTERTRQV